MIGLKSYNLLLYWVAGWLIISNFQFGGLDRPSTPTQLLIILGLISYLLGTIVFPLPRKKFPKNIIDFELKKHKRKIAYFYWFSIIPLSLTFGYLTIKAINVFVGSDTLAMRQMLLGIDGEKSVLMPSKQVHLLYELIIGSLLRVNVIIAFFMLLYYKNKLPLIISNSLLAISSIIFLGRGFLLEFGFQILLYVIIQREQGKRLTKRFWIIFTTVIGAVLVIGATIGALRGDTEDSNLIRFLKYQIVNYHTVGLVILDQEINDHFSRLNTNITIGRSTLGGLERIGVLTIRRFDKTVDSAPGQNTEDLARFRSVGESEGVNLKYNAFGTLFYTFLIDGRVLFLIIGFFWLGMLIKIINNKHNAGRPYYICFVYLFTHLMVQSVYYSPIETSNFWISFILLILIQNMPNRLNKSKFRSAEWKKV